MSTIKQEIKQCMLKIDNNADNKIKAHFLFPEHFIGFKGHFPGKPILPGICQVQALIVIAEKLHKKKAGLRRVVLAKFFKQISQDEAVLFDYTEENKQNNEFNIKALVSTVNGEKIAKLDLEINFL